jgi:hypothetical protein
MAHAIFPPPQKKDSPILSVFLSLWKSDHKKNRVAALSFWRLTSIALVALGLSLGSFSHPSPAIATGESWDSVEAATASGWISVAYGDGVWIAVAEDGAVMRSTNGGANWTAVSTGTASGDWNSVATDGNGVWVAVASSGMNRVMRSTNGGANWAAVNGPSEAWRSVVYGDGVWVAVASSGTNRVMRSTNGGANWSQAGIAVADSAGQQWMSVAYGNNVWVAVARNADLGDNRRLMRSTNRGVNWTTSRVDTHEWSSVATDGNGTWVAVASGGDNNNLNRVLRSSNEGQDWESVTVPEANGWESVAYGNGVWVAVAYSGTNRVMRSVDDGRNWSTVAPSEANRWYSVAYGNGVWVAVSFDGDNQVMRSLDPVSPDSSTPSTAESAGVPGIYLYVAGSAGRMVEGTPVYHGSFAIAPNTPYTLSLQSRDARALTRTVLGTGVTNGGGHLEGRIEFGSVAPGSYKIVMTGYHALGYPLVLTNHLVVDSAGKFVSVSPESLQPTLR